jgi:beta-lactam-binding protein with PASTA domain
MMPLPRPKKQRPKGFFLDRFAPDSRRGRFLYYYLSVPLACLIIIYLLFNNLIMPIVTRHGSEFALPDVVGKSEESARQILESSGLRLEVTSKEYQANKPEGTVLSQYPPAGTMVKSGRIIKVGSSIGQKLVIIPQLAGFSLRQAKLNIEATGLVMGEIAWTYSDSLPENVVVFSYPASGAEIPSGSTVNLMVNRGRLGGIVYMPNLIGKTLDDAKKMIVEVGLKLGTVTHVRDENYLPETVLEQSVEEATELEPGEEIDLKVSTTE